MAVEDFTTYTEVDEHGDITVTSSKVDVDTMRRDANSAVRDDKGAGHFGDFEHLVTIRIDTYDNYGVLIYWAVTNGAATLAAMKNDNDGLAIRIYRNASGVYSLNINDYTNDNTDLYTASASTTYYLTVERNGSTATCKIYSDSARTTLLDTLSITCGTGTYRFIYGIMSADSGWNPAAVADGFTENLDLQEVIEETLITTVLEITTIQDLQTFKDQLLTTAISQTSLTDIKILFENLLTQIQSQVSAVDKQTYKETLITTGVGSASVEDTTGLIESLLTIAQSSVSLTDFQIYIETISTTILSLTTAGDIQKYLESLQTIITSAVTVEEKQNFLESFLTTILGIDSISDKQYYIDNIGIIIQSQASLAEVLTYIEVVSSIGVSSTAAEDIMAQYIRGDTVKPRIFEETVYMRI